MVVIEALKSVPGQVEGGITAGGRRCDLFFRSDRELSDHAAEAFLLLALPAAMRRGEPLVMEAPVSTRLLGQLPQIQNLYHSWDPDLSEVAVRVPARPPAAPRPPGAGICEAIAFTAGVDSLYSALQTPDASLVFVHGLDIPLQNERLRARVREKVAWAAAELGRDLLEMETNLRAFSDRYFDWNLAFGGALAACALLLSRHIDAFGIPAGQTSESHWPDGADPRLVSLFSTEDVEMRAVGNEARRIEKVERIAPHPVTHSALRVCWENRGDTYNCGTCDKCLRTMASLEVFGVLDQCSVFALPLDYRRLARAVPAHPGLDMFNRENLQAARARGARPELIRSLETALARGRSRLLRRLLNSVPRAVSDRYYRVFQNPRPADPSC